MYILILLIYIYQSCLEVLVTFLPSTKLLSEEAPPRSLLELLVRSCLVVLQLQSHPLIFPAAEPLKISTQLILNINHIKFINIF